VTVPKDSFPLRTHIIGDKIMLSPNRIPPLDEMEDRVTVLIISIRDVITQNHVLQGKNMVPAGPPFNQFGVEELTTVIIAAGDEIQFIWGIG